MAPIKQRKRKSAGLGDIFEVSDKDLSPEPEENETAEPEAKVLKTQDSDVPATRRNNERHNLSDDGKEIKDNENIAETQPDEDVLKENIDSIEISDNSLSELDELYIVDGSFQASDEYPILKSPDRESIKEQCLTPIQCNDLIVEEISIKDSVELLSDETKNCSEGIFTVVDDVEDDVIINVCEETLEDGELNESTLEHIISSKCSITIKFNDKLIADIYKPKFCKFIQAFPELEIQSIDDTVIGIIRDEDLNPNEWVVVDESVFHINKSEEELAKILPETPTPENGKKKRKKKKQKQTDSFIVDTSPGATSHKPVLTKYSTKFLLNDKQQGKDKNLISKPSFSSICFNCDKEHALKDCPHPKNYAKINANRQKHQTKNKVARYHLDEDQKYGHLKPGKISVNLRKALGLQRNQVPGYVYQMRLLGYPPGWLEEAKFISSDLTLFDIDGNNVKNTNSKPRKGLDPEKVVEYPGFNVPLEKHFKDEFKYHRVPPFCDKFNKQKMIETFKEMFRHEEDDFETQDMDLDNTNDSMEDVDESKLECKQPDCSIDSDSNNEPSISLQELQKEKDCLIEEIKKSGETIPWEQMPENKQEKNNGINPSDESKIPDKELGKKSLSPPRSCVKHTVFGTPILKSSSPYNRLPNPDNFTKGVSPVIDFENLPNSTGKYEQMTDVLQKVRKTLKNLQKT